MLISLGFILFIVYRFLLFFFRFLSSLLFCYICVGVAGVLRFKFFVSLNVFLCNFSTFLFVFAFRRVKYSFCIFALVFFLSTRKSKTDTIDIFIFHLCKPNGELHCWAWGGWNAQEQLGFFFSATYSLRTFAPLTWLHNCLFCYINFRIFFCFCFFVFYIFLVFWFLFRSKIKFD